MVDFSDFLDELLSPLFEHLNSGDMRTGQGPGGDGPPIRFDGLKVPFMLAELLYGEDTGEILLDPMGCETIFAFADQD